MSRALLPAPQPDERDDGQVDPENCGADPGTQAGNKNKPGPDIPDRDDCLRKLAQLAGLVAMGFLKPAQANSMRASYSEILKSHKHAAARHEQQGLPDESILEVLERDPGLLNLLEPFLTQDQVTMILELRRDRGDGKA